MAVNTERLIQLANNDACARAFFQNSAARVRQQSVTSVERALTNLENAGHNFERHQLVAVFRELDASECGTFKIGRRGWPSRFEWSASIIAVGRNALGEAVEIEPVPEDPGDEVDADLDWLTHTFHLRPNIEIEFELPIDLSPNEAERLIGFMKSIPFELDD